MVWLGPATAGPTRPRPAALHPPPPDRRPEPTGDDRAARATASSAGQPGRHRSTTAGSPATLTWAGERVSTCPSPLQAPADQLDRSRPLVTARADRPRPARRCLHARFVEIAPAIAAGRAAWAGVGRRRVALEARSWEAYRPPPDRRAPEVRRPAGKAIGQGLRRRRRSARQAAARAARPGGDHPGRADIPSSFPAAARPSRNGTATAGRTTRRPTINPVQRLVRRRARSDQRPDRREGLPASAGRRSRRPLSAGAASAQYDGGRRRGRRLWDMTVRRGERPGDVSDPVADRHVLMLDQQPHPALRRAGRRVGRRWLHG
jgi:hypothetical protein